MIFIIFFVLCPFLLKSTRHAAANLCKQSDLSCMPQLMSVADKSLIDSKTAKKTQVTTDSNNSRSAVRTHRSLPGLPTSQKP